MQPFSKWYSVYCHLSAQIEKSSQEKIQYKKWYVIKVFHEYETTTGISNELDFALDGDHAEPYLFVLTADNHTLTLTDIPSFSKYNRFPRVPQMNNERIFYYREKIDSTKEKVNYTILSAAEDFLEIEDNEGYQYLMISNREMGN